MSAALEQIKTAYEVSGMTPEQIAEDQDLDIAAVKAGLMQSSAKYRKACGQEEEDLDGLNFTNDELRRVNQVIYETALSAELADGSVDFKTRLAAATYIRDDKKGRKEPVRHIAGNTFNLLSFNEQLQKARQFSDSMKRQLIDV